MDVLANYTTYQTFWKIEKATEEDPEYDAKKARRAIARFVSLHPHHLAQKAEIIVEHFRQHTAQGDGRAGQGDGRDLLAAARRPLQAEHRQVHPRARATPTSRRSSRSPGKIDDGTGMPLTETNMNGFPESRTAEEFATPRLSAC